MSDVKNIKLGAPIEYGFFGIKRSIEIILKNADLRDKYLLDIGCGNGARTVEFSKYAYRCMAIDVEEGRLNLFKEEIKKRSIENCEIKQMNAMNLEYSDETFDIVTCIETLEHISDQEKTFKEIYRVLKAGGELVMVVPNKWWIFETHGANLPLLPWNRIPFFSWLPEKIHDRHSYARIYTKKKIVNLVEKHGFKVYNTEYMMPPLDKVKNNLLKRIFRKILLSLEKTVLNIFGVSIFVFAQK